MANIEPNASNQQKHRSGNDKDKTRVYSQARQMLHMIRQSMKKYYPKCAIPVESAARTMFRGCKRLKKNWFQCYKDRGID